MNLAILGAGKMGRWFAKLGKEMNWNVKISDLDQEKARQVADELNLKFSKTNEGAVREAEIVIVSVPIKKTPAVIRKIGEHLEENTLLMDIASVKEQAVEAMKSLETNSELASIHPLFGPGAEDLNDKNIVSVPVRTGELYEQFKKTLSERGARIEEMEADEHDQVMSLTQSLTHFTLLTFLSTVNRTKNFEKAKDLATPMFQKLLDLSRAYLHEDPELCGSIQTENRYSPMARNSSREASRTLDLAIKAENIKFIKEIFEEAKKNLGSEEIESEYEKLYRKEDQG